MKNAILILSILITQISFCQESVNQEMEKYSFSESELELINPIMDKLKNLDDWKYQEEGLFRTTIDVKHKKDSIHLEWNGGIVLIRVKDVYLSLSNNEKEIISFLILEYRQRYLTRQQLNARKSIKN